MNSSTGKTMTVWAAIRRSVRNSAVMIGLAVSILLATTHALEARSLQWVKQSGASDSELGSAMAVDGSGNSYVTGYFEGSTTFGLGEANQTALASSGESDVFIAKYNSSGALVWAKHAGGTGFDEAFGVAADGSGNSYVTGYFEGSATFGLGEANQTTLTSSSAGSDIFVAKYSPTGALLWAKRAGGSGSGVAFAIRVDASGNSYLTGSFEGSVTFGLGETNQKTVTSDGDFDLFLAKYNSSGTLLWAKRAGGAGFDEGFGIALDGSGNSYVTGYFDGSATFGSGEANQTVLTSSGSNDVFVAKYNSSGVLLWAKRAGGTGFVNGFAIAVDASGNAYATGSFSETATFGSGEANETVLTSASGFDSFVAKYNSSGALLWAKQSSGAGFLEGFGIAVDGSGNSYVTGYFDGSTTFGLGEVNETILTSAGGFDIFVAKYNTNGSLLWAARAGGISFDVGVGIAVDGSGNSYATGYFDGVATFGVGEANQTALTSAGGFDIFVAKFTGTAFSANPATVQAGGTVTATWSGIDNPTPGDLIGLYVPGEADSALIADTWVYVSCSQVEGSSGVASGSCPLQIPASLAPGTYELRLFSNNSSLRLATSNSFTVQSPQPGVSSITPNPIDLASPPANFTVTGAGFANSGFGLSVINFMRNGVALGQARATAGTGSSLTVPFPTNATSLAGPRPGLSAGPVTVLVYNQTGSSSFSLVGSVTLTINDTRPCSLCVTGITPNPIDLASPPTNFTITGAGFVNSGSGLPVVNFMRNGVALGQARASAGNGSSLTVPFPTNATSLAGPRPGLSAGPVTVLVYNQTGSSSFSLVGSVTLTINDTRPCSLCVTGITPNSIDLASPPASFTISGAGFANSGFGLSVINFMRNGVALGQARASAGTASSLTVPFPTNATSLAGPRPGLSAGPVTVLVYNQTGLASYSLVGSTNLTVTDTRTNLSGN